MAKWIEGGARVASLNYHVRRVNSLYNKPTSTGYKATLNSASNGGNMSFSETAGSPYRVQSVYDALQLIELLISRRQPMSASQAAELLNDSRNRTFRLLKTLEESGYVIHSPADKTYRPSLKLFTLGQTVSRTFSIESLSRKIMTDLRESIGETVYLCVREGLESVCIATIESPQMVRIVAQPGSRWQLGTGATGTSLLASAPDDVIDQFLALNKGRSDVVEKARQQIKGDGVTFVDGREGTIEDEGVLAISSPIYDVSGHANYALAVAWPYTRSGASLERIRAALLEAARNIERQLGVTVAAAD